MTIFRIPPPIRIAACFLFYYAFLGVLQPYLSVVLLGLLGSQSAAIYATASVLLLMGISPPLCLHVARQARLRANLVLKLVSAVAAACAAALALLHQPLGATTVFVLFLVLFAVQAPIAALLDGMAMAMAQQKKASFGRLRLFGSSGFVLAALLVGQLNEGSAQPDLRLLLALALVMLVALTLSALLAQPSEGAVPEPNDQEASYHTTLLLLLLSVGLQAMGFGPYAFAYTPLAKDYGLDANQIGIAWSLSVASEIVCLAVGPRLLASLGWLRLCLLGNVTCVLRWVSLAAYPCQATIVGSQLLNGPSFALFMVGIMSTLPRIAGKRLLHPAQTWCTSLFNGAASSVGLMLGYFLYADGPRAQVFWPAGIAAGLSAAALGAVAYRQQRQR